MPKFREREATEAVQYTGDEAAVRAFVGESGRFYNINGHLLLVESGDDCFVDVGDWIVMGDDGPHVWTNEAFMKRYEPVDAHAEDAPPVPLGEEVPNDYTD